jgi:hypothetical protein
LRITESLIAASVDLRASLTERRESAIAFMNAEEGSLYEIVLGEARKICADARLAKLQEEEDAAA